MKPCLIRSLATEVLCCLCRDRSRGARHRQVVAAQLGLDADQDDFECPHGLPWGYQPSYPFGQVHPSAGDRPGVLPSHEVQRDRQRRTKRRQAACLAADCQHYAGGYNCERHGGCLASQTAFHESPASRCPLPEAVWGPDARASQEAQASIEHGSR